MDQVEKANHFRSLHIAGTPLVLYNIWDAGGAQALADAGVAAVATGSWSVAAAQGYADGEQIPLDFLLQIATRIAASVDLPFTLDFEGGYAKDPETLRTNVRRVIAAGAVGINLEDQVVHGQGLYPIADQTTRLRSVREAATLEGIPLFLNARTDVFLKADPSVDPADLMDEAMDRAAAYASAGADGFFIPGLKDPGLIARLCAEVSLPVNIMMRGVRISLQEIAALGVARASYGPGPYITAMADFTERYRQIA